MVFILLPLVVFCAIGLLGALLYSAAFAIAGIGRRYKVYRAGPSPVIDPDELRLLLETELEEEMGNCTSNQDTDKNSTTNKNSTANNNSTTSTDKTTTSASTSSDGKKDEKNLRLLNFCIEDYCTGAKILKDNNVSVRDVIEITAIKHGVRPYMRESLVNLAESYMKILQGALDRLDDGVLAVQEDLAGAAESFAELNIPIQIPQIREIPNKPNTYELFVDGYAVLTYNSDKTITYHNNKQITNSANNDNNNNIINNNNVIDNDDVLPSSQGKRVTFEGEDNTVPINFTSTVTDDTYVEDFVDDDEGDDDTVPLVHLSKKSQHESHLSKKDIEEIAATDKLLSAPTTVGSSSF